MPDKPATPHTIWYGASTTKAFVGTALAHLIDNKEYPLLSKGWSTPISSIIHDDFILQDDWMTRNLTLEDAACHRTGLPRHELAIFREIDDKKTGPKDIVRNLRNLNITAEPRTKFMYCNLMYIVLSHVIETITGKWLGQTLKELIWDPLGMDSTYFDLSDAANSHQHLSTGYYWDEKDDAFKPVPPMEVSDYSGAGAVFSNVVDYAKWLKCLLHEASPFSSATHKDIQTPRIMGAMPIGPMDINMYGIGWQRTLYKGHIAYSHGGSNHAFGSQVIWLPEHKFGCVVFGNTSMTSMAAATVISYRLIDDKLGIPEEKRYGFSKQ